MDNNKSFMFIKGSSTAEITKYLIKQCGGKPGVYKYLFHDKLDNVMKVQTVMSGYKIGGDGKKKCYIHQFKPEVVLKNGAEVIPTDYSEKLYDKPQAGGGFTPFRMPILPFRMPIPPIGYYAHGGPVYAPFGMGNPFSTMYSFINKGPTKQFVVDKIECKGKCEGKTLEDKKTIVKNKVQELFKNRYDGSDIIFEKLSKVEVDKTDEKVDKTDGKTEDSFTVVVDYAKKRHFVGFVTKRINLEDRITEIRDKVNNALA